MTLWTRAIGAAVTLLLAGCMHGEMPSSASQPIIDMHRHTPWPGESDSEGIALIREAMRAHDVVATALFITGREDVALYRSGGGVRFLLSPMFPCPRLTAERKWCFVESGNNLPDPRMARPGARRRRAGRDRRARLQLCRFGARRPGHGALLGARREARRSRLRP